MCPKNLRTCRFKQNHRLQKCFLRELAFKIFQISSKLCHSFSGIQSATVNMNFWLWPLASRTGGGDKFIFFIFNFLTLPIQKIGFEKPDSYVKCRGIFEIISDFQPVLECIKNKTLCYVYENEGSFTRSHAKFSVDLNFFHFSVINDSGVTEH